MLQAPLRDDENQKTEVDAPAGLGVLVVVSVSFGLAFGVYETFLPLYWKLVVGMDAATMGAIFSLAAVGVFLLRVYVGRLSDMFGRKLFYTLSLGVSCLANFATPLLASVPLQLLLKSSREASTLIRDTMHAVLLYERSAARFMGSLGITRGAEFTCHGVGSLAGGLLLVATAAADSPPNFNAPFMFSAGLILLAAVTFGLFFRPGRGASRPEAERVQSLRALFSADLPPKLWLLVAFGFTFEAGLFTTHCFIMPIYFGQILKDVLQVSTSQALLGVAVIMAVHRVVAGVPMMLVGPRLKRNLKWLFIGFVFCEGVAIAATPFVPDPWIAVAVWLMHDLLGAGIWSPIYHNYLQKHSRPESRGADVSKALGLTQLGRIVGPLLAAALLGNWIGHYQDSGPFVVGGIMVALSSLILFKL